jgi:carbon storage regulator
MLVLSRKKAERIFLANGKIKIMVLDIRGDSVRIGIDAPKDIDVHREEVFDLIQKEGSNKQQKED